jgi:hypothetical protein
VYEQKGTGMAVSHFNGHRIEAATTWRQHIGMALLAFILAAPAAAQNAAPAREITIDAAPFYGAFSIAWRTGSAWSAGIGLGAGLDELGKTLDPDDEQRFHSLEQYIYTEFFTRYKPSQRVDLDLGLRAGFGDVRECGASDCWPGPYVGAYTSLLAGWRRVKLGPRLLVARVFEHPYSDTVVHLEVLTARISFGW